MSGMNGVESTRRICTEYPGVKVLVLTTFDDDEWVFDAIRAGASGYLLKHTPREKLVEAVRGTLAGKSFIDPVVAGKILGQVATKQEKPQTLITDKLTERQWMWATYAPEPRMRLNLGIRRRLAPLLGNDRRKIELANALAFTLPGTPVLYYGDEIGMGDNIWLSDRNGVRTPMQWDSGLNSGFSISEKTYAPVIAEEPFTPQQVNLREQRSRLDSLWQTLKKLIAIRKRHPALLCGSYTWLDCTNKRVAAYLRGTEGETILVVNNLADEHQVIELNLLLSGLESAQDILGGEEIIPSSSHFNIKLNPFQYSWFKITLINLPDADKK